MSERFLEGFAVDAAALDSMIGTAKLAPAAIRKRLRGKQVLEDIDMTLGDGDEADGRIRVDAALGVLAHGRPNAKTSASDVTRVSALVLAAYGKRLGSLEVIPFVEGDSFGLWNGVFKALAMPALASAYGKPSFAFPYAKRTKQTTVDWPIMTLVDTSLAAWKRELASGWATQLAALPDKLFTHREYGTDGETIAETKRELVPAIKKLATWVGAALRAKRALVIVLDGDQ
jgi:hypothetical protein